MRRSPLYLGLATVVAGDALGLSANLPFFIPHPTMWLLIGPALFFAGWWPVLMAICLIPVVFARRRPASHGE